MVKRILQFVGICLGLAAFVAAVFGVEIFMALQGKKEPAYVNPSHEPVLIGKEGPLLKYVVIGDSTGAGEGAPYSSGVAIGTAQHLALRYRVSLYNFSISGSTAKGVVRDQLAEAALLKPDLVLLCVGANDATHFTSSAKLHSALEIIVTMLRASSPEVTIVVTGCPQMGSVPRFAQPLRWFAGTQTARINRVFSAIVSERHLAWSHIADRTGSIFQQDPTLFWEDKFHPNARGYAVWLKVLDETLDGVVK
jgi:lysophospholipase L1-like esterase